MCTEPDGSVILHQESVAGQLLHMARVARFPAIDLAQGRHLEACFSEQAAPLIASGAGRVDAAVDFIDIEASSH